MKVIFYKNHDEHCCRKQFYTILIIIEIFVTFGLQRLLGSIQIATVLVIKPRFSG